MPNALVNNPHWRWFRLGQNVGYINFKTTEASRNLLESVAKSLPKTKSTLRVWHTKHLIIAWDRENSAQDVDIVARKESRRS
jgi:hypothetical protein